MIQKLLARDTAAAHAFTSAACLARDHGLVVSVVVLRRAGTVAEARTAAAAAGVAVSIEVKVQTVCARFAEQAPCGAVDSTDRAGG
jgi:ABC-type Mn2+/Zn2+ transport system permease subunit